MEYHNFTLPNGVRIIHRQDKSPVGHCGLILNVGSRDENKEEHGMAHFIEHVVFKGTKKRKAYHILSRLDDVGGELNAYTTKEETCIYASFLKQDFERAVELIHDISFNSIFPPKEIEKEKEVIIDEINSYKDSPAELIFDEFEEMLFEGDPMGRNILGTPEHLKTFGQKEIQTFIDRNYNTDQMVFCSVADVPFKKVLAWAEKYLGQIKNNPRDFKRSEVSNYVPQSMTIEKDTHQCHVMIGNVAYDYKHPKRLHLHLLNNLLGGPGMNSRLNMALREKNGIAYNVESTYAPFYGTGVFSIYFGTDSDNLNRSFSIINKELKLLRNKSLGSLQLHKAARQLKGQIAISADNRENLMLNIGKSYLLYNQVDSLETINNKIDSIKASDLMEVANEILSDSRLSYLIYQ